MRTIATLVLIAAGLLAGVTWILRLEARGDTYKEQCVDGVWYLRFFNGVTPKYHRDGRLALCRIEDRTKK